MPKLIFVNLPVADLPRAVAFYEAVGAKMNPMFSDQTAACMVFSETIHVMLLTHEKWATFTDRAIPDAHKTAQVLLCLSEDSRAAVDRRDRARDPGRRPGRPQRQTGLRLHVQPQLRRPRRPRLGDHVDGPGSRRARS